VVEEEFEQVALCARFPAAVQHARHPNLVAALLDGAGKDPYLQSFWYPRMVARGVPEDAIRETVEL
jgi:hypothetical protein